MIVMFSICPEEPCMDSIVGHRLNESTHAHNSRAVMRTQKYVMEGRGGLSND